MTTHSKLPPSSAARRMACPGSRLMEESYGRETVNGYSLEGEAAHQLAALYLQNANLAEWAVSTQTPSVAFTDEMHEGATYYRIIIDRLCDMKTVHVEEQVALSCIHPLMWGTPDAWGIVETQLHVFDYKFGFTPVDAYENWQLLAYACGIVSKNPQVTDIYLHIVQPRDYISESKHKMWHLSASELDDYRTQLRYSEALSMSPNPELKVSEQCKYCTARHACHALQAAALGAAEASFRASPKELTSEEKGNELKLLHEARDLLDYRISALEAEVEHHLKVGANIPHYYLEPVVGRLSWNFSQDEVIKMGALFGVNLTKQELITPTQAIKAGIKKEVIEEYATRKQSLKLSKIDVNKVKAVFKNSNQ